MNFANASEQREHYCLLYWCWNPTQFYYLGIISISKLSHSNRMQNAIITTCDISLAMSRQQYSSSGFFSLLFISPHYTYAFVPMLFSLLF